MALPGLDSPVGECVGRPDECGQDPTHVTELRHEAVRERNQRHQRRPIPMSVLPFRHAFRARGLRNLPSLFLGGRWTGRSRCRRSTRRSQPVVEPYRSSQKLPANWSQSGTEFASCSKGAGKRDSKITVHHFRMRQSENV
jgi:hypothetical protein